MNESTVASAIKTLGVLSAHNSRRHMVLIPHELDHRSAKLSMSPKWFRSHTPLNPKRVKCVWWPLVKISHIAKSRKDIIVRVAIEDQVLAMAKVHLRCSDLANPTASWLWVSWQRSTLVSCYLRGLHHQSLIPVRFSPGTRSRQGPAGPRSLRTGYTALGISYGA